MNYLILVCIISFFIYLYLHIRFHLKINNNYDILQSNNPNKENFEKIINEKSPSVFTNISNKWNLQHLNQNSINENFKYYLCPLLINKKYEINNSNSKLKNNLMKENKNRHLILHIDGTRKYYLFSPNQIKYLYNIKDKSRVNYWNQDLKKYPLFNKAQFIEIIMHPHQMIYIPKNWWYAYENLESNITIDCNSNSLFSYFIN